MSTWYKTKIIYDSRNLDTRTIDTQKESYLHYGISYTDVEAQCCDTLFKKRFKALTTDDIDLIGKYKLSQVIFHPLQEDDSFWEVKVRVRDDKPYTLTFLVPAVSDIEASERVRDEMESMLVPWKVTKVSNSDVLAVWRPNSELWEGDWYNRMERLYEEGKFQIGFDGEEPEEPSDKKPRKKKTKSVPENQVAFNFDDDEANDDEREIVRSVREIRRDFQNSLRSLKADGITVSTKGPGDREYKPLN